MIRVNNKCFIVEQIYSTVCSTNLSGVSQEDAIGHEQDIGFLILLLLQRTRVFQRGLFTSTIIVQLLIALKTWVSSEQRAQFPINIKFTFITESTFLHEYYFWSWMWNNYNWFIIYEKITKIAKQFKIKIALKLSVHHQKQFQHLYSMHKNIVNNLDLT